MKGHLYSITEVAEICDARLIRQGNSEHIRKFYLDSRQIGDPRYAVFVAIKGQQQDGHQYIQHAYERGIRHFLVERTPQALPPDVSVLLVASSLVALQQMARHHRERFHYPVLAITGSNGKTTVKEWLNLMIGEDQDIIRSPKSYNSQIGVPISLLNMAHHHTLGIFEAGISKPGEMKHLRDMIQPNIGIFTNAGSAHRENFNSLEDLIEEKLKLFEHCKTIIYSKDHAKIHDALNKKFESHQLVSWSMQDAADLSIETVHTRGGSTEIIGQWRGVNIAFHFGFGDKGSIENILSCLCCLLSMGYDPSILQERLERLQAIDMRLQVLEGQHGNTIISDVYNSDIYSLEIALDFMRQQQQAQQKKVLILSDIEQSGIPASQLYDKVSQLLDYHAIDTFITVGDALKDQRPLFPDATQLFESTAALLQSGILERLKESCILIKGSRKFRFEKITQDLQRKAHETILEVNLNALVHNLNVFRRMIPGDVGTMAMVKAFGYGSGGIEVAKALEFNGIDYLGVAFTDEGVALREAGIKTPIIVLNPEKNSLAALIKYKLEPEIYSLRSLFQFGEALDHQSEKPSHFPVHIKLDTGMHRLGFDEKDLNSLIEELKKRPAIRVGSVFSHMAASDDDNLRDFSLHQIAAFQRMSKILQDGLPYPFLRHMANTQGVLHFPEAYFDMVRLGIGLYGIGENPGQALRHVTTMRTVISQIKRIAPGESVGYGRQFIAEKPVVSATIPVGYADGLSRGLSKGKGHVLIGGQSAKIIGNVCMDMAMVDVSHINCHEGDEVIVFGAELTIDEIAKTLGTISYEIMASIPARVKRIYVYD